MDDHLQYTQSLEKRIKALEDQVANLTKSIEYSISNRADKKIFRENIADIKRTREGFEEWLKEDDPSYMTENEKLKYNVFKIRKQRERFVENMREIKNG